VGVCVAAVAANYLGGIDVDSSGNAVTVLGFTSATATMGGTVLANPGATGTMVFKDRQKVPWCGQSACFRPLLLLLSRATELLSTVGRPGATAPLPRQVRPPPPFSLSAGSGNACLTGYFRGCGQTWAVFAAKQQQWLPGWCVSPTLVPPCRVCSFSRPSPPPIYNPLPHSFCCLPRWSFRQRAVV
jgi:hypothetical protein